jgi:hypothetical protein
VSQEKMVDPKETSEKIEKDKDLNSLIPKESLEKEVCWDKPFTLSGGCCQD